jgi:hypothetical protein
VQKIVRELNQLGVPTPESVKNRRAPPRHPAPRNAWNYSSVLKILFNPTHAGLVRKPRSGELFHAQFFEHRYYDPEVYQELLESATSAKPAGAPTASARAPVSRRSCCSAAS